MSTLQEIELFSQFAREQLSRDGTDLTISDLFTLWQNRNRTAESLAEDAAAIQFAIDEIDSGAPTRDISELLNEFREELEDPRES